MFTAKLYTGFLVSGTTIPKRMCKLERARDFAIFLDIAETDQNIVWESTQVASGNSPSYFRMTRLYVTKHMSLAITRLVVLLEVKRFFKDAC